MSVRFNVDAILEENRPVITFRGKEYTVKDLTVKETISHIRNAQKKEDEIVLMLIIMKAKKTKRKPMMNKHQTQKNVLHQQKGRRRK